MLKIHCRYDELVPVGNLKPYPKNRNKHPKYQIKRLAKLFRYQGVRAPIVVSTLSGCIVKGHGTVQAIKQAEATHAPVVYQDFESTDQEYAFVQSDNAIAQWAELDLSGINEDLPELGPDFDLEQLGLRDFKLDAGDKYAGPKEAGALARKFVVPPFTVLDTRQGYWQERKAEWLKRTGNLSLTKEAVLLPEASRDSDAFNFTTTINEGSSNFDPVLAEVICTWFGLPGGMWLDPFGGEQTKGVVAGELGMRYAAVEFRAEQVEVNRKATAKYPGVQYVQGDSNNIAKLLPPGPYDLVFTSPPYYDLEVYSKEDMSALGSYQEFMAQYRNIFTQCVSMLADNRFLVVKIGEIRDKKTHGYRNFVGDNIALFRDELGLEYYNELVLLAPAGTAQLRASRYMRTRKMVKLHQNVLVFFKGDPAAIPDLFPELELPEATNGG